MDWKWLVIRSAAGGLLVVAFSMLAEIIVPKRLAGVFAGAPSVAIASRLLTLISGVLTPWRTWGSA